MSSWRMLVFLIQLLYFQHASGEFVNRFQENVNRIIGGREAIPYSHPHIVSLQYKMIFYHQHTCGGSILNDFWVLTAGHCIRQSLSRLFFPMVAIAGIHSVNAQESSAQIIKVVNKIIHPDYQGGVNPNDIALLKLEKPFSFNERVQPVHLPKPKTTPTGEATLSGWGLLKSAPDDIRPENLQEIDLPILTFKECYDSVAQFHDQNPLTEDSNICTGPLTGGKSACNGDSGGPLVQKQGDLTVQIGLVSWGYNPCGTAGTPTIYTKVSSFIDFINVYINN